MDFGVARGGIRDLDGAGEYVFLDSVGGFQMFGIGLGASSELAKSYETFEKVSDDPRKGGQWNVPNLRGARRSRY